MELEHLVWNNYAESFILKLKVLCILCFSTMTSLLCFTCTITRSTSKLTSIHGMNIMYLHRAIRSSISYKNPTLSYNLLTDIVIWHWDLLPTNHIQHIHHTLNISLHTYEFQYQFNVPSACGSLLSIPNTVLLLYMQKMPDIF